MCTLFCTRVKLVRRTSARSSTPTALVLQKEVLMTHYGTTTEQHWALVTGSTGGIGSHMCHELSARGWSLVLTGRSRDKLDKLAAELAPTPCYVQVADLSSPDGPQTLVDALDKAHITVDMLVNNAGMGYTAPLISSDAAHQHEVVQLDVMAPLYLSQEFGARMATRRRGAIITIASVAATMPGPGMSTYFASKAFVLSLSEALHEELHPHGVKVLAVCPGPLNTNFWQAAGSRADAARNLFTSPRVVCRGSLRALKLGRTVYAPGLLSKVCYVFGRLMPGIISRKVAGLLLGK